MIVFTRTFAFQGVLIRSHSMSDALLDGDLILVNRAALGTYIRYLGFRTPGYSSPRRSDIIIFDLRRGRGQQATFAKRLIGLPGDTLRMCDRVLYINGVEIEEPYATHTDAQDESGPEMGWQVAYLASQAKPSTYYPTRDNWGPLVVPAGRYFVLGDRRSSSRDSRHFGFIEISQIRGRAGIVILSVDRNAQSGVRSIRWSRVGRFPH